MIDWQKYGKERREVEIKSDYIFLPNPYAQTKYIEKQDDGTLVVNLAHSFMTHFAAAFPNAVKISEHSDVFRAEYICNIEIANDTVETRLTVHNVNETHYVSVAVISKKKSSLIHALEFIHNAFSDSAWNQDYILIVAYDAISEYYCNKMYRRLNKLERNLRHLLLNIYTLQLGTDYYQNTVSDKLQEKVNGRLQSKGGKKNKEIRRIQESFYELEFGDMEELLFATHWTALDEQAKEEFLAQHADLTKLPDKTLRDAYANVAPKSDWERFFADKMDAEIIRDLLNKVRKERNRVAHCKSFDYSHYSECLKAVKRLDSAIMSAITATEERDFYWKNTEGLRKALAYSSERFAGYKEALTTMQKTMQELKELLGTHSWQAATSSAGNVASQIQKQLQKATKPSQRRKEQIQLMISNEIRRKKRKR